MTQTVLSSASIEDIGIRWKLFYKCIYFATDQINLILCFIDNAICCLTFSTFFQDFMSHIRFWLMELLHKHRPNIQWWFRISWQNILAVQFSAALPGLPFVFLYILQLPCSTCCLFLELAAMIVFSSYVLCLLYLWYNKHVFML